MTSLATSAKDRVIGAAESAAKTAMDVASKGPNSGEAHIQTDSASGLDKAKSVSKKRAENGSSSCSAENTEARRAEETGLPQQKPFSSTDGCLTLKVKFRLPYFQGIQDFEFCGEIHLTLENFILSTEVRKIFRRIETASMAQLLEPVFPDFLNQLS